MKYNEKVERFAPKLGRKNLANGLSCPPFVYMDDSDDGMWVHYGKYCKNIAKQKYKRCLAMARIASDDWHLHHSFYVMGHQDFEKRKCERYQKWQQRWLELAEKFKPNKEAK